MNFWTVVHGSACVFYIFCCFYVLNKNYYSAANWILAMLFSSIALWSGGSALIYNTYASLEFAENVLKIRSIGWAFTIFFLIYFILLYTKNDRVLKEPLFYGSSLGLTLFFIWTQFSGKLVNCCAETGFGLASVWRNNPYSLGFFLYFIIAGGSCVFMMHFFRKKYRGSLNVMTKMNDIIYYTLLFSVVSSLIVSFGFKYTGIYSAMEPNVMFIPFVFGIIYSIRKYGMSEMTAVSVAVDIIESLGTGIIILTKGGVIAAVNSAACGMIMALNHSEGRKPGELGMNERLVSALQEKTGSISMEIREETGAGCRDIVISLRPYRREGRDSGRICVMRDITENKKYGKDLSESIEKLSLSNAELENFVNIVSHDLKSPARVVSLYSGLLKRKLEGRLNGEEQGFLDTALSEIGRFHVILAGILKYCRLRPANMKSTAVKLDETVRRAVNSIPGADVSVKVKIGGDFPAAYGDAEMLKQLFENLLENSMKFRSKEEPDVVISAKEENDGIIISVEDNGMGVEPVYFERIFGMFERLHAIGVYPGEGMGLTLCRKIAEINNGRIWVETPVSGRGTLFKVFLPKVPL